MRTIDWRDAVWFAVPFGLCAALLNWASVFLLSWWDPAVGDPGANARLGYLLIVVLLVPIGSCSYLCGLWSARKRVRNGSAARAVGCAVASLVIFATLIVAWPTLVAVLLWLFIGPGLLAATFGAVARRASG